MPKQRSHHVLVRVTFDKPVTKTVAAKEFAAQADYEARIRSALVSPPPAPAIPEGWNAATTDVLAERRRQIEAEGWTQEHEDKHGHGELARAAGVYALAAGSDDYRWVLRRLPPNDNLAGALALWPWEPEWFKPKDRRGDLVKAAALILAEIERQDRAMLSAAALAVPE